MSLKTIIAQLSRAAPGCFRPRGRFWNRDLDRYRVRVLPAILLFFTFLGPFVPVFILAAAPGPGSVRALEAAPATASFPASLALNTSLEQRDRASPALPAVTGGGYHTLLIKEDGTVWAWGRGGALGDGSSRDENRLEPVQVRHLTGVNAVDASASHSVVRTAAGHTWSWGSGLLGALGHGDSRRRDFPARVQTLNGVVDVAAGSGFTLALLEDGTVWAWGDNSEGQLGDGTRESRYRPVQVEALSGVKALSAGNNHAVALKKDGTVWAWGLALLGADTFRTELPVQVPELTAVSAVAAGGEHTLILREDGTVWAWGRGVYGQLGRGAMTSARSPVQIKGLGDVVSVSAGDSHSLALEANGTVWAWGYNREGQLGTGTVSEDFPLGETIPRMVQGLEGVNVVSLAAGGFAGEVFSLATAARDEIILQIGEPEARSGSFVLYAWGDNGYGQLGSGTLERQAFPVQVPVDLTSRTLLDVAPILEEERTLVPLRFLGETLGATLNWDAEKRQVTLRRDELEVVLWIEQKQALVNDLPVELEVPPRIVRSRTLVPLRFVGETLGAEFQWDSQTREITIRPGDPDAGQ